MVSRRQEREYAIQILYQIESNNTKDKNSLIVNKKIITNFINNFFYNFLNNNFFIPIH